MKPTVIRTDDVQDKTVKPTVIPTQTSPAPAPDPPPSKALKPTVMPSSKPPEPVAKATAKPTAMPNVSTPPKTAAVTRPTAIPGVERKRISVTLADLQALNPQTKEPVLEKALAIIRITNVEEATDRTVVLWGQDLQKTYTDLVAKCLTLSQSEIISKVTGHIGRMMEILESIDLMKICGLDGNNNALKRFLKKASSKIDSLPELWEAQKELNRLVRLLSDRLDKLLTLKEEFELVSKKIDETGDEVEASLIAATFVADYINRNPQPAKGDLAQRFSDRSMSLTQTLAQIRGSSSMRAVQVEQPLHLIQAVQHVALVMVPGWLGSIASMKAMLEGRNRPSPTDVGELSDQMQEIIQKLKGS